MKEIQKVFQKLLREQKICGRQRRRRTRRRKNRYKNIKSPRVYGGDLIIIYQQSLSNNRELNGIRTETGQIGSFYNIPIPTQILLQVVLYLMKYVIQGFKEFYVIGGTNLWNRMKTIFSHISLTALYLFQNNLTEIPILWAFKDCIFLSGVSIMAPCVQCLESIQPPDTIVCTGRLLYSPILVAGGLVSELWDMTCVTGWNVYLWEYLHSNGVWLKWHVLWIQWEFLPIYKDPW